MRSSAALFLGSFAVALVSLGAVAGTEEWHKSSSLLGDSKYGSDFQRYDYVNPNAPKGGTYNSIARGTFDSFNPYIVQGTAAAGFVGIRAGLLYDTLMDFSRDEPGVSHPRLAEAYTYPDDYSSATYRLDPRARWHDGTPVTVEDVVWTFNVMKAESPNYIPYYSNVTEAVALNDREVQFRFDQKGNRELPKIIGDLVVLPKHWWEGIDPSGKKRDVTRPTLEPPMGSGPYKIESFKPGSEIIWRRVEDYWGTALPVNVGRNNFDRRRFTYIKDDNAAWQAFTKGGLGDTRSENSSRRWATSYNFPAAKAGDVLKASYPAHALENMQAFVMNTRRPKFQDRRVREALTYAYDFETMNRTIFFGFNHRVHSFFEGGELASSGLPQGKELEILEQYRDQLPPELFTQEYKLPVYEQPPPRPGDPVQPVPANPPEPERAILRRAVALFAEAGWKIQDGKMTNEKTGEPFTFEILGSSETDEVIANPYINMLRKIGVTATLRIVDPTQAQNRENTFDFDMITTTLGQSESPGNEQRDYWSSKAADRHGSQNFAGIKDPVVDALVERIIFATDREDLIAATHALDRVLLWGHYVVPQHTRGEVWLAYWDKFGIPEKQPDYIGPDIDSWWIDPEKEAVLSAKYGSSN